MQEYKDVLESNTVQEMRTMVNDNFNTIRSTHAGEAFPTENLVLGMKCFRTDEKKTYTLVSMDPLEWAVEASGGDIVNAQKYLAFVGREALGRLTDWSGLFNRALSVEVVDFADLGTGAYVTNMSKMFNNCVSLKTVLNLNLPPSHVVRDVHGMFSECTALSVLDVTGFKAGNIENFMEMFSNCRSIKVLDMSQWKTGRATNMCRMFYRCQALEALDVSKWNVSKCMDFAEMFRDCHKLRGLNLTAWDTSKAIAMGGMFRSCGNSPVAHEGSGDFAAVHVIPLKLDLSAFDLSNVETTSHMFAYARCQLTIGEKMRKTSKCKNMDNMFLNFWADAEPVIDGAEYQPSVIGTDYTINDYGTTFPASCKKTIFTAFDFSSVEDMSGMFEGVYAVNCTLNDKFTGVKDQISRGLIFHVSTPKVQIISRMFYAANGADFIDFSMDMGSVTNVMWLFSGWLGTSIRLRNFDTRHIGKRLEHVGETLSLVERYNMDRVFAGCRNLRYLIIDGTEFRFRLFTDILADLPSGCRFIVPRAMIATYKTQDFWKNYPDRFIAMEDCQLYGAYVKRAPT